LSLKAELEVKIPEDLKRFQKDLTKMHNLK